MNLCVIERPLCLGAVALGWARARGHWCQESRLSGDADVAACVFLPSPPFPRRAAVPPVVTSGADLESCMAPWPRDWKQHRLERCGSERYRHKGDQAPIRPTTLRHTAPSTFHTLSTTTALLHTLQGHLEAVDSTAYLPSHTDDTVTVEDPHHAYVTSSQHGEKRADGVFSSPSIANASAYSIDCARSPQLPWRTPHFWGAME